MLLIFLQLRIRQLKLLKRFFHKSVSTFTSILIKLPVKIRFILHFNESHVMLTFQNVEQHLQVAATQGLSLQRLLDAKF